MSVAAVARKDFRDGIRSKLLWVLMALFVLSIGGLAYLSTRNVPDGAGGEFTLLALLSSSLMAIILLIPITGLVVSIKSIVRERELGSLKIMLSLPHTRGEVVLGKFVGRSSLLVVAILSGFLPAGLIFALRIDNFPVVEYAAFVLVLLLFGIVFVAVGLGVSALVSTETRATVAGVGLFFLLYFLSPILNWLNSQVDLLSGDAYLFAERFYLPWVLVDAMYALLSIRHTVPNSSFVAIPGSIDDPSQVEAISQPFYLQHWFAFVILAFWIAVPLAIGYYRFERTDL